MNGPEHYREAEQLIEQARDVQADSGPGCGSVELLAEAQVHATLAQVAATALPAIGRYWGRTPGDDAERRWAQVTE